jgi:hypothetical protein
VCARASTKNYKHGDKANTESKAEYDLYMCRACASSTASVVYNRMKGRLRKITLKGYDRKRPWSILRYCNVTLLPVGSDDNNRKPEDSLL